MGYKRSLCAVFVFISEVFRHFFFVAFQVLTPFSRKIDTLIQSEEHSI